MATYQAALEAWDALAFGVQAELARSLEASAPPVDVAALVAAGVPKGAAQYFTPGLAAATLAEVERRRRAGLCSLKQARHLTRHGLRADLPHDLAREALDGIQALGWRAVPRRFLDDPRPRFAERAAEGNAA